MFSDPTVYFMHLPVMGMLLARVWGFLLAVPFFGTEAAPLTFRNGLALSLAAMVFPLYKTMAIPESPADLSAAIGWEFAVGLMLGGIVRLLFTGIQLAGQLAGFGIGLSMARVIDPSSDIEDSLGPVFYQFFGTVLFLIAGGHRALLSAFIDSYAILPLGQGALSGQLVRITVSITGALFDAGLRMAAPVAALLFIVDLLLSLASRIVPQIPILIVGMPAKTWLGIAALGWGLEAFAGPCLRWLSKSSGLVTDFAQLLAAAS